MVLKEIRYCASFNTSSLITTIIWATYDRIDRGATMNGQEEPNATIDDALQPFGDGAVVDDYDGYPYRLNDKE